MQFTYLPNTLGRNVIQLGWSSSAQLMSKNFIYHILPCKNHWYNIGSENSEINSETNPALKGQPECTRHAMQRVLAQCKFLSRLEKPRYIY